MTKKFKGYVSMVRNFLDEFPFNNSGKIATLWFDEIIFQTDAIRKVTEFVAGKDDWDSKTLKALNKMWVPVKKYIPEIEFFNKDLMPEHPDLKETVFKITYKETKKEAEKSGFDISKKGNYYAMMHKGGNNPKMSIISLMSEIIARTLTGFTTYIPLFLSDLAY